MSAAAVLPGTEYGRWTVIGDCVTSSNGQKKWLCRCACGTERYVMERSLLYGGSFSCGCLRRERTQQNRTRDIAGQTFGNLTVLRRAEHQATANGVWWTCRCTCGTMCDVLATLLTTGRKTHCGCKAEHHYHYVDVTGQRFQRLTALYPTQERSRRGGRMWHCRCDCGSEVDVPYNELVFCHRQSCGCQKKEHDEKLSGFLTHVAGTALEQLKSRKLPSNNTTGVKGVYLIRGKYVAKIVFQKKQYYLGAYDRIEKATEARREAEEILAAGTLRHYERWKIRADQDPGWGKANPVQINVEHHSGGGFSIVFLPEMDGCIL